MKKYKWLVTNAIKNNKFLIIFLILISILCGILQSEKIVLIQRLVMLVKNISVEKMCFCLTGIFLICVINDIKSPLNEILYTKIQKNIYERYWNILGQKLEKLSILKYDEYDFIIDLDRTKKTINSCICNCIKQIMALITTFSILGSLVIIILNTDIMYIMLFGVLSLIQNTILLINTRHTSYFMKAQDKLWHKEKYYKNLLQSRKSLKEIRIYNCGKWIFNKRINNFVYIKEDHIKFSQKWSRINIISGIIMYFIEGAIFFYMFFELSQGTKNSGEVLLLIQAQELFCNSIFSFLEIVTSIKQDLSYVQSLFRIINEEEEIQIVMIEEHKAIRLQDIFFSYHGGGKIIDGISLNLNKGEKVVLVGENGSGKSTLAKILAGLIKVDKGDISYSNSKITAIFQDFSQFNLSIGENIWFESNEKYKNDIDKMEAEKTCQFISNYADGFNTLVGPDLYENGVEMSGGQWQQIGIMRAIAKRAEIIIFDEPTSALDPISEQKYFNKIKDLLEGKTVILITHRIGLAKFGDKICFIEKGKIVEEGSYYKLLEKKEKFYKYFEMQMKWYK